MPVSPSSPLIIVTHEFYPRRGGIATFTEEIARAASLAGRSVEVWAQEAPASSPEKAWPFGIRRMPLKGTHGLMCQLRLAREFVRNRKVLKDALVYLPEPGPIFTLMWLQFIPAFRPPCIVLTFHGSEIRKFHRNPLIRPLARRLFRHAKRLSILTQYSRNLLQRHFPETIDHAVLTPGALRSDCDIQEDTQTSHRDKIVILTVGRLHPRKGQMHTLRALQALSTEVRDQIEYWLVGAEAKQDYDTQLHHQANASDLTVRFLGDLPDDQLSATYDQADIFALTSVEYRHSVEGFGLVYLEASAHGLPVVAHDIGGVSEAVSDGHTGILVSPDHPKELTATFARLIADSSLRQQLGQAGRKWARHNSWRESVEQLTTFPSPDSTT